MITEGKWKRYGQQIHLDDNKRSSEIVTVLCPGWMSKSEAEANAHLIAASPLMYEALKEISKGKGRYSQDSFTHARNTIEDMRELALTALAKVNEEEVK